MAFPITPKYFLRFRHSDTGLTPVFSFIKRADTLADLVAPTIYAVANGSYYFSWTFASKNDPDVVFEVDGGASIPTEEVRYIGDTISPKSYFLDEPLSQVSGDVWGDDASYGAGSKGKRVDQLGDPTDASAAATLFGHDLKTREASRGDSAGATDGNSSKDVYERVGTPLGASLSADLQADVLAIKGAGSKDLTQVDTHLGTVETNVTSALNTVTTAVAGITPPDNSSISDIKAKTDLIPRLLGMLHENSVLDKASYDAATNNLISARFRIYPDAATAQQARNAGDTADDVDRIAQYSIVAQYSGDNMLNYMVVREFPGGAV